MHCHFSAIEFTSQGEKRHRTLDEKRYVTDFSLLAQLIVDFGLHHTIICETPILDIDAKKMKEILKETYTIKQQEERRTL